jgi:hypothetical protein
MIFRFVCDHDVDVAVAMMLRKAGHEAWTAADAGLYRAGDDDLTVYADNKDAPTSRQIPTMPFVVIMTAAKTVSRGSDAVSGPPDSMMLSEPNGSPTPTRSRSAGDPLRFHTAAVSSRAMTGVAAVRMVLGARELAPTAGQAGARQLVNPGSTSACPSRLACIGTHKPASLKRLFPRTAQGVPGGNRVFEDVVLSTASRIRGGCHQRSRVIGNRGLRR